MPKGKSASDEGLKYLIERRRRWLVRVAVPRDLRGHPAFLTERGEPKAHVEQYLGTDSRAKAKVLKAAAIRKIKDSFERARVGGPATDQEIKAIAEINLRRAFERLAAGIMDNIDRLPDLETDIKAFLDNPELGDVLGPMVGHPLLETVPADKAAADLQHRGIAPTKDAVNRQAKANLKAYATAIAMLRRGMAPPPMPAQPAPRHGAPGRLDEHVDDWLATLSTEEKSKAMARSTVTKFADQFPLVENVNRPAVQKYVNGLLHGGIKPATIRRSLSELRGYWKYLAPLFGLPVGELDHPFKGLTLPKIPKKAKARDARKAFEPADVVRLFETAEANGDSTLAELIRLAMYTGERREELCALKVEHVKRDHFEIVDAKTEAGFREVPVHPKLAQTMRRLVEASKDGYLLPLTATKYGDRGDAIGKHFSRLKTELGFSDKYVFHSIRRTVTTMLEEAGVPGHVIDDTLGWDREDTMRGHYSEGVSLKVKRAAIERIKYPSLKRGAKQGK